MIISPISQKAFAEEIDRNVIVEFNESSNGFMLSCDNITENNRSSLTNEIIVKLTNEHKINDTMYYINYITKYIDLMSVEESFTVSTSTYNVVQNSQEISTFATTNDVSIVNTITRNSSGDKNGYKAFNCVAFCEWSKAPINRYKDIFAISIESNTTPLYENLDGKMKSIFNVHGQSRYDILGKSDRVSEHSIPGAVGVKFDLPANSILGGLIYIKMQFTVSVTVFTQSDFNMYSGFAHRVAVGAPTLSADGASFSVNKGTDLFTGNVVSQII